MLLNGGLGMDITVFRAALRASAKVALTATLTSCGGALQTTSNDDSHDAGSTSVLRPDDAAPPTDSVALTDAVAMADAFAMTDAPAMTDAAQHLACDPPPVQSLLPTSMHPGVTISDATFDCCLDLLAAELPSDAQLPMLGDAAAHDPNVIGCCAAAVYRFESDFADPDASARDQGDFAEAGLGPWAPWDYLQPCCGPLGVPLGPTCTPWGPPMPPAMPEMA
jgi:hypothetical protein